jgi:hypothetical protein
MYIDLNALDIIGLIVVFFGIKDSNWWMATTGALLVWLF